ncbi:MAG: site-specific integrase [Planctomycetaceae bacterium]|nr:site-specific integrase [Planctomycetaceae bacterium]
MASVSTDTNGRRRIIFVMPDGRRPALYVGEISKAEARNIGRHVDHLVRCSKTGEESRRSTQEWLCRLSDEWPKLADKLCELGLLNNGHKPDEVFADFVENYIGSRKDVKPGTVKTWGQACQKVREFFGRRTIKSLTVKDGKDFLRWLRTPAADGGAGHRGETPSKHLGHVRCFLNEAVNAEIIPANPFRAVRARRTPRQGRRQLIAADDVVRVINTAPDAEMRAIIALSFWGGLRTPSEHFVLKWGCIRWDEGMMTVHSPKTEAVGKELREVPLFPELVPYLLELQEVSKLTGPDDFVIQKRRNQSEANLRGRMTRLCIKAGIEPWPKIFQNLRSTRQTILEQFYPRGTACQWMGNTEDVAEAHYVQEIKDFRKHAAETPTPTTDTRVGDRHTTDSKHAKTTRNPTRAWRETGRTDENCRKSRSEQTSPGTQRFIDSNANSGAVRRKLRQVQAEVDGNRTHQ